MQKRIMIKMANRSFGNVAPFKYLEMTITKILFMRKSRAGGIQVMACYHSVQNIFLFSAA
jgi:hypothetical protein